MNNESLQSFTSDLPSRFGSVVAHPELVGEVSGSSPDIPKTLKMVLTDPQLVLVIMRLSKGNV